MAAGTTATSRIRWVQREQTQLLRPTYLALAGLYCYIVLCMRVKPFCVCGMATWLDVANRQGVLGGSWTRLGSEARWTSQMPCRCVAIGSKGASEALLLLSGGKPGRRGPDAATFTFNTLTHGRHGHLHRRTRVSKAPQEGSRRLSWALRHSAFTCF
jgi:hypothetical protein